MPRKGISLLLSTPDCSKPFPGEVVFVKLKIASDHYYVGITDSYDKLDTYCNMFCTLPGYAILIN
jgi:hypothetical protein